MNTILRKQFLAHVGQTSACGVPHLRPLDHLAIDHDVHVVGRLPLHGFHHAGIGMADVADRNARHQIVEGAMSLMGEPEGEEWKGAFRPLLPDVRAIDFNDFDQLRLITRRTACVVVEPVQGEAGVRTPAPGWLEALRRRCDEVGALLVFDEIQTGMGRTGEMFAMCKYGVTPDIVCLAKAFGGGMPLGAFVSRKEIMDTLQTAPTLGHITTFGGHPVCCAAGLAALEYLLETGTVEHVEGRGALYESLLADHPQVVEIRRSGLLPEDMPVENDLSHWVWTYTFTNADYDAAVARGPMTEQ